MGVEVAPDVLDFLVAQNRVTEFDASDSAARLRFGMSSPVYTNAVPTGFDLPVDIDPLLSRLTRTCPPTRSTAFLIHAYATGNDPSLSGASDASAMYPHHDFL